MLYLVAWRSRESLGKPGERQEPPAFRRGEDVRLNYDGTTVTGTQEHNLLVAYWDGDAWVDIADSCPGSTYALQPERDQISVPICHLSQFALLSKFENRLYLPLVLKY
jgi:hypothetical protein